MLLNHVQYETVKRWVYRNARPLDLARWQYHFEEGDSDNVVKSLEAYQNEDGGFGNGLEADCWNSYSSPMTTWWAIQFMKEIELPKDHPMIQGTLSYLDSGDGFANGVWLNTVPSNNDFPGAPWWQHSEEGNHYSGYNPGAALAGFILKNAEAGNALYLKAKSIVDQAVAFFVATEALVEMHELACFVELYEDLIGLDGLVSKDLLGHYKSKLKQQVYDTIERDSSKWPITYCCKPSHFIKDTSSLFYEDYKVLVEEELKMILGNMNAEGVWDVTWQWGSYDREFAISSRWWQTNVALMNMKLLRCFD